MLVIGTRIREARKRMGYTQAQLAEKSGLSRSYLADVERGIYAPSLKSLVAIASATETDLNFLSGMTEIPVFPSAPSASHTADVAQAVSHKAV